MALSGYLAKLSEAKDVSERVDNNDELLLQFNKLVSGYMVQSSEDLSLTSFLDYIVSYDSEQSDKAGVFVGTIHSAKGLEFDNAFYMDIKISDNLTVRLINAWHVPGSAYFIFTVDNKKVLFSGNLGSGYSRSNGEFDIPEKVDLIFMEATYAE